MRIRIHRRKTTMPRVRARGIVEKWNTVSGILYCEKGRPSARAPHGGAPPMAGDRQAGGMSF
jgi:hypothetical protein